jgi:ppGpp synthetase/RelA/SpoT-type nucleotidyltranferase
MVVKMAWAVPQNSRNQVDRAGKIISKMTASATIDQLSAAYETVDNWRSCHGYPLNTFQVTLRRRAAAISSSVSVSQRTKRLESIIRKLRSGNMQLTQMQDIAGCRAVLENVGMARKLQSHYMSGGYHDFKNIKDYISNPKNDGYRSVHLIYRFRGTEDRRHYDDLQVEIQIRSQLQHAWATAVEAVSTFTRQALKWQGGSDDWQRFFALMSSAIAKIEGTPVVEGTTNSKRVLRSEIGSLVKTLNVRNLFQAYKLTLDYAGSLSRSEAKLLLVHMIPDEAKLQVKGFKLREFQEANQEYMNKEKELREGSAEQVVLVKVDSLQSLRRAYPNYFLGSGPINWVADQSAD